MLKFYIHALLYSYSCYTDSYSRLYIFIFMLYLFIFMYIYIFIFMLYLFIFMLFHAYIYIFIFMLYLFIFMLFYIHIHGILIHIHAFYIHIHGIFFIFMYLYSHSCYIFIFKCPGSSKKIIHDKMSRIFNKNHSTFFWKRQLSLVCGIQDLHSGDLTDCIININSKDLQ